MTQATTSIYQQHDRKTTSKHTTPATTVSGTVECIYTYTHWIVVDAIISKKLCPKNVFRDFLLAWHINILLVAWYHSLRHINILLVPQFTSARHQVFINLLLLQSTPCKKLEAHSRQQEDWFLLSLSPLFLSRHNYHPWAWLQRLQTDS